MNTETTTQTNRESYPHVRVGASATVHYSEHFGTLCNSWNTGKRIRETNDDVTCKRCAALAKLPG